MSTNDPFVQGQLVSAAQAVLIAHRHMVDLGKKSRPLDVVNELQDRLVAEMLRLADNTITFRNDWGDPVQLAALIVFLGEGYVPSVCLED